jgi:hypothetical protein
MKYSVKNFLIWKEVETITGRMGWGCKNVLKNKLGLTRESKEVRT